MLGEQKADKPEVTELYNKCMEQQTIMRGLLDQLTVVRELVQANSLIID